MENKEEIMQLKNINEAVLDGVKSFIITQLDEMVLPFIYKNELMFSDINSIYQEYLRINADINNLYIIYSDKSINLVDKKAQINDWVVELYKRTKDLIVKVSLEEKKTNNDNYTQLKKK